MLSMYTLDLLPFTENKKFLTKSRMKDGWYNAFAKYYMGQLGLQGNV